MPIREGTPVVQPDKALRAMSPFSAVHASPFAAAARRRSLLSLHVIPIHMRESDFMAARDLQPPVIKFVDASPETINRYHALSPMSLIWVRDWALSEQHSDLFANPEATGRRHAQEMYEKVRNLRVPLSQVVVSGINEPRVWDDVHAVVRYYTAFCDECYRLGIRAVALNLSVGWPANKGGNTPPDWSPYEPVRQAIVRGGHYLGAHEYTDAQQDVTGMAGWWTGRVLTCPWDVPILIGEWGVDVYVSDPSVAFERRGWRAWMGPDQFMALSARYNEVMASDVRVKGICGFTSDSNKDWFSFDFEPIYPQWRQFVQQVGGGQPPATDKPVPPVVNRPTNPPAELVHPCPGFPISQHFYQNPENYAQYGLPGHNGTDFAIPERTPLRCPCNGTVEYVGTDRDYGNYVRVYSPVLAAHFFLAHLHSASVQAGQILQTNDIVGLSGNTGRSTGPHLHLEVRIGSKNSYSTLTPMAKGRVDPETFFSMHRVKL